VKNHPFVDGNKRTGILAAVAFLALNNVQLEFDEPEIVGWCLVWQQVKSKKRNLPNGCDVQPPNAD
jgi:prophage maintenance system killer protein